MEYLTYSRLGEILTSVDSAISLSSRASSAIRAKSSVASDVINW